MLRNYPYIAAFLYLALISPKAAACAAHEYFNPDNFGVITGAALKLAGLTAPEPVFKLKHAPVAKAVQGEPSELTINFERPWRSSNVTMQFKSTPGIQLIDTSIALEDFEGAVKLRYLLEKPGFNNITIKISGEYKNESISSSRVVYIQPKKTLRKPTNQQVVTR
ncbi:hypothetical protein [Oceanicoccus sagamiensis]|uniref:CopC domain-containing protein n=1 Tax=Oceanicoccus sagamiensis TaxID=716816 RepID=A0A1X9NFA1_9GAMM|nr:hypothetical protein [Oceanicoccus sagamiensis]ARN72703.1 hypothetical protein BST96_00375 [Oceanicoccus sagamiensis]